MKTFYLTGLVMMICFACGPMKLQAGVGTEIVKQAGKAATKVVAGKIVESGTRNVAKQLAVKLGVEAAESTAKGAASIIAKGGLGDDVAKFAWRNKGTIVGGAALATAVANPKESIAASANLLGQGIQAGASNVAGPIATKVAKDTGGVFWVLVVLSVASVGTFVAFKKWNSAKRKLASIIK